MKKTFLAALAAFVIAVMPTTAQTIAPDSIPAPKIGYLSYNEILKGLPEYAAAMQQLAELTKQYEAEAQYNETNFKRKFSEYLQGQKDFPQNILLRRQRDLQEEMEKSLAFRDASDSLLRQAEIDLLAPLKADLDRAIRTVGIERGYIEIINLDLRSHLFLNPANSESAAPFVLERLNGAKQ